MIKQSLAIITVLSFCVSLHAQTLTPLPFSTISTTETRVQKNIVYGQPADKHIKEKYYQLDLYSPGDHPEIKRPLIIMMHGGGFKLGSKKSNSTPVFSKAFAQHGYICASINYRLSRKKPLSNFKDLAEGCFDAIADLQQAIKFFRENAGKFNVDTNNIFLAGNSAGGMMALQAVYANPRSLAMLFNAKLADSLSQDPFVTNIRAVVNCWGAIYDSAWLQAAKVPVVSVHGSKDRVVPLNFKDSTIFGSAVIHRQTDYFGIPNKISVYDGIGHELARHFNPFWSGPASRKRCREAAAFICKFLASQVISPGKPSVIVP